MSKTTSSTDATTRRTDPAANTPTATEGGTPEGADLAPMTSVADIEAQARRAAAQHGAGDPSDRPLNYGRPPTPEEWRNMGLDAAAYERAFGSGAIAPTPAAPAGSETAPALPPYTKFGQDAIDFAAANGLRLSFRATQDRPAQPDVLTAEQARTVAPHRLPDLFVVPPPSHLDVVRSRT
jgi:hypothetical protein